MHRGRYRSCMMVATLHLTVQLLVIVTHLALVQAQAQECGFGITTCNECLTMGCSWAGSCGPECPSENLPCVLPEMASSTSTIEQLCAAFELSSMDRDACNFASDSCGTCVQTALVSDPSRQCQWFVGIYSTYVYCAPSCIGFFGSCDDQERDTCDPPTSQECSDASACSYCMRLGCAWADEGCSKECPADSECVSSELNSTFPIQQRCDAFFSRDTDACNSANDSCDECVETTLVSDPNDQCQWFVGCDGTCPYCAPFCDRFLGSCDEQKRNNTCDPPTYQECDAVSTCTDCLRLGCEWSGSCNLDCPTETPCARPEFASSTRPIRQVCDVFELNSKDRSACNFASDSCDMCVQTALVSDPNRRCQWFVGIYSTYVYCAPSCIGFFGSCDDQKRDTCDPPTIQECSAVSACSYCMRLGCAWADGGCSKECPADSECVSSELDSTLTIRDQCTAFRFRDHNRGACNSANDSCDECVGTAIVSYSRDRCQWFVGCDGTCPYCAPFCNGLFLGSSCDDQERNTCYPPTDQECSAVSSCTDCVRLGCEWGGGGCSLMCPTDSDCVFPEIASSTRPIQQVCDVFELNSKDRSACNFASDSCDMCVQTALVSDQGARCKWFVGCAGDCSYCAPFCNGFLGSCDYQEGNTCDEGGEKGGKKKGKKGQE